MGPVPSNPGIAYTSISIGVDPIVRPRRQSSRQGVIRLPFHIRSPLFPLSRHRAGSCSKTPGYRVYARINGFPAQHDFLFGRRLCRGLFQGLGPAPGTGQRRTPVRIRPPDFRNAAPCPDQSRPEKDCRNPDPVLSWVPFHQALFHRILAYRTPPLFKMHRLFPSGVVLFPWAACQNDRPRF
jgi:hypothetical protein